MSKAATTTEAVTETTPEQAVEPNPAQEAAQAKADADKARSEGDDLATWKAEARKWEAQAKANSEAAARLNELEEAQKSELQKANEARERAEQALAAKEAEALRLSIASKNGIAGDYVDLLHGADADELEANAAKIRKLIESTGTTQKGAVGPYVPPEGSTPSDDSLNGDPLLADLKSKLGIS